MDSAITYTKTYSNGDESWRYPSWALQLLLYYATCVVHAYASSSPHMRFSTCMHVDM